MVLLYFIGPSDLSGYQPRVVLRRYKDFECMRERVVVRRVEDEAHQADDMSASPT